MAMTQRQLAAQETRKKLLDAGRTLINAKGLANTSVEEITEAAGVSKGTFYTYFKRKEDIVFELSKGMFGEILENARAFEGDFLQKLTYYMVNFSGHIEDSSVKLAQEWVSNVAGPCPAKQMYDRGKLPYDLASVTELLKHGVSQGLLPEELSVEALAHTLVDVLYGQMLCWAMSDGAYSLKERTREFCELYLEDLVNVSGGIIR